MNAPDDLRGLWLSRLMFNQFVGWPPETRTFEEFAADMDGKPAPTSEDTEGCQA